MTIRDEDRTIPEHESGDWNVSWEHWQITDLLRQFGVEYVYHWTPADGLASILSHGVLSRSTLDYRRIQYQPHSYGSAEKETFLRNFVGVSFKTKRWMMGEWCHQLPVVVAIDADILATEGTLFVRGNSAARAVPLPQVRTSKGPAALDDLFGPHGLVGESEAWVRWLIPSSAIRSVHVPNEGLATNVLSQVSQGSSGLRQSSVLVSPDMFLAPGSAEVYRTIRDSGSDVEDLPF